MSRPAGHATYLCVLGCVANCLCAVRASSVWYDADDAGTVTVDRGGEYDEVPGLPCVVFRSDADHPHPPKHIAIGEDGLLHEWADGDTACRRYRLCPDCEMTTCPATVEVAG